MFQSLQRKWLALGIITLLALNFFAFYLRQQSLDSAKLLNHASADLKESIQQKQMYTDFMITSVTILDGVALILLLFFGLKILLRKTKTQS